MPIGPITIAVIIAFFAIAAVVILPIFLRDRNDDLDEDEDLDPAALRAENERAIAARQAELRAAMPAAAAVPMMHRLPGDGLDWLQDATDQAAIPESDSGIAAHANHALTDLDRIHDDYNTGITGAGIDASGFHLLRD